MKNMCGGYYLLGIFFFGLLGCAHKAEQIAEIEFPFETDLLVKTQQSFQHSASDFFPSKGDDVGKGPDQQKSPRRVYFSALYYQFVTLGEFLKKKNSLDSCPQFHHDKILSDDILVPKVSLESSQYKITNAEYFPELVFSKKFSVRDYYQNLKKEILTLCEEGMSDNYYKFDNLITHYSGKKSFHLKPESMKSILKIPVFANYYLLKMIQIPRPQSHSIPDEKLVINLTHTHWFEKYVLEARKIRTNLVKNQLVKR